MGIRSNSKFPDVRLLKERKGGKYFVGLTVHPRQGMAIASCIAAGGLDFILITWH
jgi:hypothetical protein